MNLEVISILIETVIFKVIYCDMTLESRNSEVRVDVYC
jgi:uncharacterized membrane protein YhdT